MSLINDALKKAQKQRTGESPPLATMPAIGGETAGRIAKRAKPVGFNTLLLRIGLIGGALLVVLVGGYLTLRATRPDAAATPPPAATKAMVTELATRPPVPAVSAPVTPAVTFKLPIATAAPETPPSSAVSPVASSPSPQPVKQAEPAPAVVTSTPTVVPAPAAPAAKLGPKAISYIESLRIAGIRASATDSKVLMNDRVYRTGDIVEHELGLKLIGITASSLSFEDEHGARYTRNF